MSTDRLIDALWSGEPPADGDGVAAELHLAARKVARRGHDRDAAARLCDAARGRAARPRDACGGSSTRRGRAIRAAGATARARRLRSGAASRWPSSRTSRSRRPEIARLTELRLALIEERAEAELAIGRHAELVRDLEALVREHPLRERLRGQLMLALYRSGRQADALEVYRPGREELVETLGIEPSPLLQQIHASILRQEAPPPGEGTTPAGDHFEEVARCSSPAGSRSSSAPTPSRSRPSSRASSALDCGAARARRASRRRSRRSTAPGRCTTRCTRSSRPTACRGRCTASSPGCRRCCASAGWRQPLLVTTGYELALEQALEEAGESSTASATSRAGRIAAASATSRRTGDADADRAPERVRAELSLERRTVVLHLQGRLDASPERAWESFAVTEDDFIHYGDIAGRLPVALAARLRRTHLLLLGYTLSDWTLRVVLERLWGEEPLAYRSWSVHAGPQPLEREFWRRRNVEVVDMAPAAYVAELERVVARERRDDRCCPRARTRVLPRSATRARRAAVLRARAGARGDRREPAREPADHPLRAERGRQELAAACRRRAAAARARRRRRRRARRVGGGPEAGLVAAVHDCRSRARARRPGSSTRSRRPRSATGRSISLLDQFEEYFLHHGAAGRSATRCPNCCAARACASTCSSRCATTRSPNSTRSPGASPSSSRTCCASTGSIATPARAAIVGPLERYGELADATYGAEPALVEAMLDEVAAGRVDLGGASSGAIARARRGAVSAARARAAVGRGAGGRIARAAARDVPAARRRRADPARARVRRARAAAGAEQDAAARLVRQLVTPSGTKTSHTAADLADYAGVDPADCSRCSTCSPASASCASSRARRAGRRATRSSTTSSRGRCSPGGRLRARARAHRRAAAAPAAAVARRGRSRRPPHRQRRRGVRTRPAKHARSQARRAHARELAADALAGIPSNPAASVSLALCMRRSSCPARRRRAFCARACSRCESSTSCGSAAQSSQRASRRTGTGCSSPAATACSASTTRPVAESSSLPRQPLHRDGLEPGRTVLRHRRLPTGPSWCGAPPTCPSGDESTRRRRSRCLHLPETGSSAGSGGHLRIVSTAGARSARFASTARSSPRR